MRDNILLNKILNNFIDFRQYLKKEMNGIKFIRIFDEEGNIKMDFINLRNNKLRTLKVTGTFLNEDTNRDVIHYQFYDKNMNYIENNPVYDDILIGEICEVMRQYKNPIERKFNVSKQDFKSFYIKEVDFYKNDESIITVYENFILLKDGNKSETYFKDYNNNIVEEEINKETLNILENSYKYYKSYIEDKNEIVIDDIKLIKEEDFKEMLKETSVYKKADKRHKHQKTVDIFKFLSIFSIGVLLLFSLKFGFSEVINSIIFIFGAFLTMGPIVSMAIELASSNPDYIGLMSDKNARILKFEDLISFDDKYIDINNNEEILKHFQVNDFVLNKPIEKEIKMIESSEGKTDTNKLEIKRNEEFNENIDLINNYIKKINEEKLIDRDNVINTYYIPEINKNLKDYTNLNDEYKSLLKENIELLKNKLEDILNNKERENTMQTEVGIKVMNRELKASR